MARLPGWDLAIAFRWSSETDHWTLRATSWLAGFFSCSDSKGLCHVDLIIRRPCLGWPMCPYRVSAHNGDDQWLHEKCASHLVSFGVRDRADSHTVTCTLEQGFSAEASWSFLALRAKPAQVDAVHDFLMAQVGKPYNTLGSNCNMLPCNLYCCTCLQCGTSYGEAQHKEAGKSWFCSELVSASLIHGHIIATVDVQPKATSPAALYDFLTEHKCGWPVSNKQLQAVTDIIL